MMADPHDIATAGGLRLDAPDAPPIRLAWAALLDAVRAPTRLLAGLAGCAAVDARLRAAGLDVPEAPEACLVHRDAAGVLLAGRDARGLAYALWDAVDAVRPTGDPWADLCPARSAPPLARRAVSLALQNADLERAWYDDMHHWHAYFALLMRCRFNTFLLRFADQTNFLAPPYPWLFAVPEHPAVRVDGLTSEARARNLARLREIGALATDYGLDFGVAIWQQQPVAEPGAPEGPYARNYGRVDVRGLPEGAALADYATRGLARLLQTCPSIRVVQLRMNYESGIPEAAQDAYFAALFALLRREAPGVRLELRYKGLRAESTARAVDAGLDVAVSTKFWCEHLGLPYHPTAQDPRYSASRYGYGTLLRHPRTHAVTYQLWNQGSNRVWVWGDPAYAARLTESCLLGEGEGFEISAPLTNRGWGNAPGAWPLLVAPAPHAWDFQRYWPCYLAFGRWGYDPATPDAVWTRAFTARFGAAGVPLAEACRTAARVLPLITASTMPSASEWSYWPEMDTCGSLERYSVLPPGDLAQFYAIRAWQPVAGWACEAWTPSPGFVEDALADTLTAKWTPIAVSRLLDALAGAVEAGLAAVPDDLTPEGRLLVVDLRATACLARYHAAKKRAATHLAFFYATGERGRLPEVLAHACAAQAAWEALARVTDGIYADDLVFGRSRETVGTPEHPVNGHAGHWRDRLPQVRADVAFARALLAEQGGDGAYTVYPGEVPPASMPEIRHTPRGAVVTAQVASALPLRAALLHVRPMDQTQAWRALPLAAVGGETYRATIPLADFPDDVDLQYYLEARVDGGGTLWPDWQRETPYVKLTRREAHAPL
jgi:hypothetical protein